jgi:hypothetical protein
MSEYYSFDGLGGEENPRRLFLFLYVQKSLIFKNKESVGD